MTTKATLGVVDADILARANHTGAQAISTVTGLQTALDDLDTAVDTKGTQTDNTWTPVLEFGGATTGITYTTQTGYYAKVGNLVCAEFVVVLSSKGSATGQAKIRGFPFQPIGLPAGAVMMLGAASLSGGVTIVGVSGSTTFNLHMQAATAATTLADTNFTNTSTLRGTLTYRVV